MPTLDIKVVLFRILLAVVLAGIIGIERQAKGQPAGFRTHILVCLGATIVMLTSEYIFIEYYEYVNLDPARMGAQVVSGIGFLGAGAIMHQGNTTKGLTTAATLWIMACIGMAVGIGFYEVAIISAVLVFVALKLFKGIGRMVQRRSSRMDLLITIRNTPGKIGEVCTLLDEQGISIRNMVFLTDMQDCPDEIDINFSLDAPHHTKHDKLVSALSSLDGVLAVEHQ